MLSPTLVKFLTCTLVLCGSISLYANNNDPLNKQELAKVATLVGSTTSSTNSDSIRSLGTRNTNQEVLLIERHEQKGAPKSQRYADMFIYDYATDELIESLVDLNSSHVISTQRKQYIQLPLTENELKRTKQIVFADEDERQVLENEYLRITSKQLTDISELNIKAFVFTADSMPNRINEASKLCGLHRCAQLMLYTQENIVFEITPIVNLSRNIVTQRIGF